MECVRVSQDAEPAAAHEQLCADEPHAHAVHPRAAALQLEHGGGRGQRHRRRRRGAAAEAGADAAHEQGQLAGQPALSTSDSDLRGRADLVVLHGGEQAAAEQGGQVPHARLHRVPGGHARVRLLRARRQQQQQQPREDAGAGESQSARLPRQHPQDPGAGLWTFCRIRGKKRDRKEKEGKVFYAKLEKRRFARRLRHPSAVLVALISTVN